MTQTEEVLSYDTLERLRWFLIRYPEQLASIEGRVPFDLGDYDYVDSIVRDEETGRIGLVIFFDPMGNITFWGDDLDGAMTAALEKMARPGFDPWDITCGKKEHVGELGR